MLRYLIASLVMVGSLEFAVLQDDVGASLSRAEALYYEARFRESIDLLSPIDAALQSQPNRLQEKTSIKLQLALAYIGLSETALAKNRLAELSALDPDYYLDPQRFSAKVISMFQEAKTEQDAATCQTVCITAEELFVIGNSDALISHIESSGSNCGCLRTTATDAAQHYFQTGMDAYKKENFTVALGNFHTALKLSPKHELAGEYAKLSQDKLRLAAEQSFLEWRAVFEARDFPRAAADFHQLESSNVEGAAAPALDRMRAQYRQALSLLVESWSAACAKGDVAIMESMRLQAAELLPDPSIGQDLVEQMKTCLKAGCLQMQSQIAMSRLRTRVNPKISGGVPAGPLTVRIKARIDEEGNVTVTGTQGGNLAIRNAVQTALERWKFLPAVVENKPRCVDTEIPIVITP